jgi:septal ring factor EnvC (AmiA/AmiB activator)
MIPLFGWWALLLLTGGRSDEPIQPGELKARAKQLEEELLRLNKHLGAMQESSSRISDEITKLELERAIIAQKRQMAETRLALALAEQTRLGKQLETLAERRLQQQEVLSSRLRSLYKYGHTGLLDLLLRAKDWQEWLTTLHYSQVLTLRDQRLVAELQRSAEQMTQLKDAMALIAAEATRMHGELQAQELAMDASLQKRNQTYQRVRRQQAEKKRLFEELVLEREEIQLMIQRLSAGSLPDATLWLPIRRYKGRLEWPVQGKRLRDFGIFEDPEFKTKLMRSGVDLEATKGTPVKAVYHGKVLFADWFKSYGNLVILDHGDGVTSFYAHNDRLQVAKGDQVERGQIIALSGDTGSLEGAFLHFEIRQQGKPEDPARWVRP